jgi:hypothetical protein
LPDGLYIHCLLMDCMLDTSDSDSHMLACSYLCLDIAFDGLLDPEHFLDGWFDGFPFSDGLNSVLS